MNRYNESSEDDSANEGGDSEGENAYENDITQGNRWIQKLLHKRPDPETKTENIQQIDTENNVHHEKKRETDETTLKLNTDRSQMFSLAGQKGNTRPPKILKARDEDLWQQYGDDDDQEVLFDKENLQKKDMEMKNLNKKDLLRIGQDEDEETIFAKEESGLRKRRKYTDPKKPQQKQYKKTRHGYERLDFEEEHLDLKEYDRIQQRAQRKRTRILGKYNPKPGFGQTNADDISEGAFKRYDEKTSKGKLDKGQKHISGVPTAKAFRQFGIFGFAEQMNQSFMDFFKIWQDTAINREIKKATFRQRGPVYGDYKRRGQTEKIYGITHDEARTLEQLPDYIYDNIIKHMLKTQPKGENRYNHFKQAAEDWLKTTMPQAKEKTEREQIEKMKAHHKSMYDKYTSEHIAKRTAKPHYDKDVTTLTDKDKDEIQRALKGEMVQYHTSEGDNKAWVPPEITQEHLAAHPDYKPPTQQTI